jgi:hypothetical protein
MRKVISSTLSPPGQLEDVSLRKMTTHTQVDSPVLENIPAGLSLADLRGLQTFVVTVTRSSEVLHSDTS